MSAIVTHPIAISRTWPRRPAGASAGSIRQVFLPSGALPAPAAGEALLGVIAFGTALPGGLPPVLPRAAVPLDGIGGGPVLEAWFGAGPVAYGEADGIRYARSPDLLFGVIRAPSEILESAAREAYPRVIRLARAEGYPALVRMWNYFPGINTECRGLERYRRFCLGRYQAFAETGYAFGEELPAASAIGSSGGDLWIGFIAARHSPLQIENPRQVSAYRYPPSYGPRSPSFSRAMLHTAGADRSLFISGTASILRHATVHAGDPLRQCETTLENLRALLSQVGRTDPQALGEQATWKVYLRRGEDLEPVRALLGEALAPDSPVMYLVGDICRADLLLEIEGLVRFRNDFAPADD